MEPPQAEVEAYRVMVAIYTRVIDVKDQHVLFEGSRERIFLGDFIDFRPGDRVKIMFMKDQAPCPLSTNTTPQT